MKHVALFDYQRLLKDRMVNNQSYALWLRPGLGKTLTTLSAIHELRRQGLKGHILLIAPLAVVRATWGAEIIKWGMDDEINQVYLSIDEKTGKPLPQKKRHERYRSLADMPDSLLLINQDAVVDMVDFFIRPTAHIRHPHAATLKSIAKHLEQAGLPARVLAGLKGAFHIQDIKDLPADQCNEFQWRVDVLAAKWDKRPAWPAPTIIIDEAQGFKSPSTTRTHALLRLRRLGLVNRLYELTGSPEPSSVEDLWSQVTIMDDGRTLGGTLKEFRRRYMQRDPKIQERWIAQPDAQERINREVVPYAMAMSNPGLKLPPLTIDDVTIPLDDATMDRYRRFRRNSIMQLEDGRVVDAVNAGVLMGKLLQFASGTLYPEAGSHEYVIIHRAKMDMLADLLENMDTPVLIAYWFQSDKTEILKRFDARSSTPVTLFTGTRQEQEDWNAGRISAALTTPASMAYGVNLQDGPGHTIIWYTMPPGNLAMYEQFNRRIYRMGQKEPTIIHRLLTKGTADMRMAPLLRMKAANQQSLMDATDGRRELAIMAQVIDGEAQDAGLDVHVAQ